MPNFTPLERAVTKFFWDPMLRRLVHAQGVFGGGVAEAPSAANFVNRYLVRPLMVPSRNMVGRIADRGEEVVLESLRKGEITPEQSLWTRGQLQAARDGMQMLDEHPVRRRINLAMLDDGLKGFMNKHGLDPTSDEWFNVRKEFETGAQTERARDLGLIVNRADEVIAPFWQPGEADRIIRRNPAIIDINKVEPHIFNQWVKALSEQVMQNPQLRGLAQTELLQEPTHERVASLLKELVIQESRSTPFRPPVGIVRSPARILLRRSLPDIPEQWRMHPFQELMIGLHDEFSFAADSAILGRGGKRLQATINWLKGEIAPEDVMELSKDTRGQIDQLHRIFGRAPEATGRVQRELGEMLENLARASTGTFKEDAWVWGLRQGLVPAGAVSMMAFSALPNMTQATSELITRGFGPFVKAFLRRGDREAARTVAILTGQQAGAMGIPDFLHGVPMVNEALLKRGGTRPLLSLFDPGWWWDNFSIIQKHGVRGMKAAAEEFLQANGFVSVEDWLRRGATVAIQDEIPQLQARLRANPNDAGALRRMRGYGFDDVQRFVNTALPTDPNEMRRMFWSGDIEQVVKVQDWQRMYFNGVGQTQFNYVPGDFPMIFAHPLWGSVGMQFRRFSYSQATKVVGNVLNEASAGNPVPLLYMAASVAGGGEIIRRLRSLFQQRDVTFVDGQPVYAEEPTVTRGKDVRTPFGTIVTPDQRRLLENLTAMGLMGLYTDTFMTISEDKPLLLASWGIGVFPSELFNLVGKMAGGVSEAAFGADPALGYGRLGGPKVQEAVRQGVREIPFFGRLISPHVRWGRSRYLRLREFGMRSFVGGDFENFQKIQRVMTEQFLNPITVDDIVNRMYKQALKEQGLGEQAPQPGDPGYIAYRALAEREGRASRRTPARPTDVYAVQQKSGQREAEFLRRLQQQEEE